MLTSGAIENGPLPKPAGPRYTSRPKLGAKRETIAMAAKHDSEPHRRNWRNFVRLLAASTGAIILALILMAIFLL